MDSEELLFRVKTYDLVLIGWVTVMSARGVPFPRWRRCLGSLIHSPRAALVCEADEGEVACGSLLRHDL